jgi:deferrochelatase/peroxidase EfeB
MSRTKSAVQEGIYFRRGERPPAFFMLLLLRLRANPAVDAAGACDLLAKLWDVYAGLKEGRVRDLPGVQVPDGNLGVLLGFGAKAFDLSSAGSSVSDELRESFAHLKQGETPEKLAGKPIARKSGEIDSYDSGICYAADRDELIDLGDVAFAVQFTADTPLAVERAVVETWKELHDEEKLLHDEGRNHGPALELAAVFSGSQRDDGRSWIDFHDGLSNLSPDEREGVIVIGPDSGRAASHWTINGTYLAFIRLGIDLERWRELSDSRQERLVGRDKLNGCPLESFPGPVDGPGTVAAGCPVQGKLITDLDNLRFRAPTVSKGDTTAGETHIGRSNQRVAGVKASNPTSHRIFRQGYPFLEHQRASPGTSGGPFRVGLNFVSFQNTPQRLIGMLTKRTWLGQTNFGGSDLEGPDPVTLLTAYAAGMFFVPSLAADEPFPGCRVLER